MTKARIDARFAALKAEGRAAFVAYVMAGDPDAATALAIVKGLPAAGADIIELGFPFSDPMAEGPPIQRAAQRALAKGMTLKGTLDLARAFRDGDDDTPIIMMGYTNPLVTWGYDAFARDAVGGAAPMVGALRKLAQKNLSNLTPHPWFSGFYYSHPTLVEREAALAKLG